MRFELRQYWQTVVPAALGVACIVASTAFAQQGGSLVSGSLKVAEDYFAAEEAAPNQRTHYWEEWNGALEARPPHLDFVRRVAVVVTGTGTGAGSTTPTTVKMLGGDFMPSTIVMRADSLLKIDNQDDIAHEVYVDNMLGFSAEATAPHQVRSIRIPRNARANATIYDRRVPHARGHLHIEPTLVGTATVAADGRFGFAGLAPGTYALKVFVGDEEVVSQPLVVAAGRPPMTIEPITIRHVPRHEHAEGGHKGKRDEE